MLNYLGVFLFLVSASISIPIEAREIKSVQEGSKSQWRLLTDSYNQNNLRTPCPGKTIPFEKSRKVNGIAQTCGSGTSVYPRFPEAIPDDVYTQWTKLEVRKNREAMQLLRQENSDVSWTGKIPYNTNITWSYIAKYEGQNSSACGYDYIPDTCKKEIHSTREVCIDIPDAPTGGGYDSGGSDSSDSDSGGSDDSGGGYEDDDSGWGSTEPKDNGQRYASLNKVLTVINPISSAEAAQSCHDESYVSGYENYTCYNQVAKTCVFEETETDSFFCQQNQLEYTAKFEKPSLDKWGPGKDSGYHDVLPNKYDLLPGENEIVVLGVYGSSVLDPVAKIENKWNEYSVTFSPKQIACDINSEPKLDVKIYTTKRIVRKSPNALVIPVDRDGSPKKALLFNEIFIDSKMLPGRPYEIRLVDSSSQVITAAARQSRKFEKMEENSPEEIVHNSEKMGTANKGFWKDTRFRIRLYQTHTVGRDIRFTDNIMTDSSKVEVSSSNIKIPLEGEAGVTNLYHPSGRPLLLGWFFGTSKFDDVSLTPGKNYELRISMLQPGMPFYISGCENGAVDCEGEEVNEKAFSDELLMKFETDENVDQRSTWEKFIDWQRKPLWEKFGF